MAQLLRLLLLKTAGKAFFNEKEFKMKTFIYKNKTYEVDDFDFLHDDENWDKNF